MDINKIPRSLLTAVRQNLGAENEDDTQFDKRIIHLTPKELVEYFCGWHLGDRSWATTFIDYYEYLKRAETPTKKIK